MDAHFRSMSIVLVKILAWSTHINKVHIYLKIRVFFLEQTGLLDHVHTADTGTIGMMADIPGTHTGDKVQNLGFFPV